MSISYDVNIVRRHIQLTYNYVTDCKGITDFGIKWAKDWHVLKPTNQP